MSNRNPDASYKQLTQALSFVIAQSIKQLHTVNVGTVVKYDPASKRAQVQPALDLLLASGERQAHAVLADVPVVHGAGGGYVVHLPVRAGDAVLLLFSERGLQEFKKTYRRSAPDNTAIMALKDAVAITGFGSLVQALPVTDGLYVGTEDGSEYVAVQSGRVKVKAAEIVLEGNVRANGGALTHNGTNVGDDHTHGGVDRGPGSTDGPN